MKNEGGRIRRRKWKREEGKMGWSGIGRMRWDGGGMWESNRGKRGHRRTYRTCIKHMASRGNEREHKQLGDSVLEVGNIISATDSRQRAGK